MTPNKPTRELTCADFQEQLPDLFAANGNGTPEDPDLKEHLKTCENCSALVRDLQYIADQASLLLHAMDLLGVRPAVGERNLDLDVLPRAHRGDGLLRMELGGGTQDDGVDVVAGEDLVQVG